MGIVHRDIKPSNLMIECSHLAPRDVAVRSSEFGMGSAEDPSPSGRRLAVARRGQGEGNSALRTELARRGGNSKLWITDFGLARIESDATAGLTMTGDLLPPHRHLLPRYHPLRDPHPPPRLPHHRPPDIAPPNRQRRSTRTAKNQRLNPRRPRNDPA
jgi:serine/threonine protein kinase